ncbi:hypothetical protein [Comamonas sp. JC664]|uniref:hypothetical protein n=1 Tax=Comamonas sp. JC664 TaxID=2801917 RepID=UPI001748908A|nr:hypothetical protein [Comamonas sp. JC664]MBL0698932.1 hypothetical protein [Comamonas sp. JC664]GHG79624.1 hypothetical protein GCM10012319_31670 [Comamonas sp. KCTC 72670]
MRHLTDQERATLARNRGTTHVRVIVIRSAASAVDLGHLLGRDWVMGVQWNVSQDETVALATVAVRRNGPGGIVSLSPMVATSPANRGPTGFVEPLLKEGRTFRIDVQTTPGTPPVPGGWRQVFLGRIDDVDAGPEELSFSGRDFAGVLQDVFIETERPYGNDTVGEAVQTVMSRIIGDNVPVGTGPALYVPVDPMWQLGRYSQDTETVHEACQKLAAQLGWELRLRFIDGQGWLLVLQSPERLADEPVWAFGPEDYVELSRVQRKLTDIRNAVEVVYWDASDRDALGNPKRKTVVSLNPTSIAELGRRYMQVLEASTSNINTAAEAQRLADAAIADLSDSALEVEMEVPYHWALEVNDVVRVQPDDVHLDEPVDLAIVSMDPVFTTGTAKMKLVLRGRPSVSRAEWKARNARPSTGSSPAERSLQVTARMQGPDAPTELAPTPTVNGFALSFKPPSSGPEWDAFELHVSTSPGFTPGASTLKAAASATRFEVADLQPGTTHYAVVRGRDAHGNVGPASAQVALSPRYVAPNDMAPLVIFSSLTPNPSFEAWTNREQAPPDGWQMVAGTFGVDAVRTTTADAATYAVTFPATTAGEKLMGSQYFAVTSGQTYVARLRYLKPTGVVGVGGARMELRWYDAAFAEIALAAALTEGTAIGAWASLVRHAVAPNGARYARLLVGRASPAVAVTVDNGLVEPYTTPQQAAQPVVVFANGWSAYTSNGRAAPSYYRDSTGRIRLQGAMAGGTINTPAFMLPQQYSPLAVIDHPVVCAGTAQGVLVIGPDGTVTLERGNVSFVSLEGVSFRGAE